MQQVKVTMLKNYCTAHHHPVLRVFCTCFIQSDQISAVLVFESKLAHACSIQNKRSFKNQAKDFYSIVDQTLILSLGYLIAVNISFKFFIDSKTKAAKTGNVK